MKIRDNLQYWHGLDVLAGLHEQIEHDLQGFVRAFADTKTLHGIRTTMMHKLCETVDLGYLNPEFVGAIEAVVQLVDRDVKVAYRFRHEYYDAAQCNAELRDAVEHRMQMSL